MDEVNAVVRDPIAGLTSPVWFFFLLAGAVVALWTRHTIARSIVAVCAVATIAYREMMLYVFLRLVFDYHKTHGGLSNEFADGARVVYSYGKATQLYSCGVVLLVAALVSLRLPRRAPNAK